MTDVTKSIRIRHTIDEQTAELIKTRKEHGLMVGPTSMVDAVNQALAAYIPQIRKQQAAEIRNRKKDHVAA